MTDKTDSKERDALMKEFGFFVEEQSGVWTLIEDSGCTRPANIYERVLWQEMLAGRASLAASAGSEPVAPYAIDADPLGIRSTVADAITGALAFGAQGVNPPPEGHWLEPFWNAAKADRVLQSSAGDVPHGWLYSWTHSSATGRPDEDYTAFTQDEQYARNGVGHRDVIAVYTHPSPPEGMVGGWTKASQQLPPCRDDQLYLGVNFQGFAGVFNAVADVDGFVHCMYETPEETIEVMSGLDIWQPFTPPTMSADSGKGE